MPVKGSFRQISPKSWQIRISFGKNPTTGKYDRHQETFYPTDPKNIRKSEKECQDYIDKLIYEYRTGEKPGNNNMNMAEFFDYWMKNYVETNLKHSTIRTYKSTVKNHISPSAISKIKLKDFTPLHLDQLYNDLRGKKSNGVLKDIHTCFGGAMDRAYVWKFIPRKFAIDSVEPLPRKERIKEKAQKKIRQTWNADQALYFLNYAEKNCDRRFYIYLIAFTTGLRRGENLGLKWDKLNLEENYYKIAGSITDGRYEEYVKTEESAGDVYMIPYVAEKLKAYQKIQGKQRLSYGKAYNNEGWVHATSLGERIMHPDTVTDKFKEDLLACNAERESKKLAPLPVITLHDLRHTVATLLYDKFDVSLERVAEILRHSDPRFTRRVYEHPTVELQKKPLDNINNLFEQQKA